MDISRMAIGLGFAAVAAVAAAGASLRGAIDADSYTVLYREFEGGHGSVAARARNIRISDSMTDALPADARATGL